MPFINLKPEEVCSRKIFVRRGTFCQREFVVFEDGELVHILDKDRLYIGDGDSYGGVKISNKAILNIDTKSDYASFVIDINNQSLRGLVDGDIVLDNASKKAYRVFAQDYSHQGDDNCEGDDSQNCTRLYFEQVNVTEEELKKLKNSYMPLSGGTMLGDISMGNTAFIKNVPLPVDDEDGVPKIYVDNKFSALSARIDLIKSKITTYCLDCILYEGIYPPPPPKPKCPPKIITKPIDKIVAKNSTVEFEVTADACASITYYWYYNNSLISGENKRKLTIKNVDISKSGKYTVEVKTIDGSLKADATLTVSSEIKIITHPIGSTVVEKTSKELSVVAVGDAPIKYQWRKNGTNIVGATNSIYKISSMALTDAGEYDVVVSNGISSATSNKAVLKVDALVKPTIKKQPISLSVDIGNKAEFSVVATGSPPLNYQWDKDGKNIAGATLDKFIINSVTSSDISKYAVTVSNSVGSVKSVYANLNYKATGAMVIYQKLTDTVKLPENIKYALVIDDSTKSFKYVGTRRGFKILDKIGDNEFTVPSDVDSIIVHVIGGGGSNGWYIGGKNPRGNGWVGREWGYYYDLKHARIATGGGGGGGYSVFSLTVKPNSTFNKVNGDSLIVGDGGTPYKIETTKVKDGYRYKDKLTYSFTDGQNSIFKLKDFSKSIISHGGNSSFSKDINYVFPDDDLYRHHGDKPTLGTFMGGAGGNVDQVSISDINSVYHFTGINLANGGIKNEDTKNPKNNLGTNNKGGYGGNSGSAVEIYKSGAFGSFGKSWEPLFKYGIGGKVGGYGFIKDISYGNGADGYKNLTEYPNFSKGQQGAIIIEW